MQLRSDSMVGSYPLLILTIFCVVSFFIMLGLIFVFTPPVKGCHRCSPIVAGESSQPLLLPFSLDAK
jgi:hypothetical protein